MNNRNREHADLLIEFTEKREEFDKRGQPEALPAGIAKGLGVPLAILIIRQSLQCRIARFIEEEYKITLD